ncbi:hypothetical protein [Leptospira sp. GIMC2001]|uniref:hypothetical protein n=1 Tax=Leptospira sp. GIMC2001 TaxID=1513297 RepID=UPI00234B9F9C|nr:hypothetical protein [Leptospira sp. GIMC2001]WCL50655.1 hypothetical protein O4O04_07555 [Leptospira sp. GIMC2001]
MEIKKEKIEEINSICLANKISIEVSDNNDWVDLSILLPNGSIDRKISPISDEQIELLMENNFQNYCFLENYNCVYNRKENKIISFLLLDNNTYGVSFYIYLLHIYKKYNRFIVKEEIEYYFSMDKESIIPENIEIIDDSDKTIKIIIGKPNNFYRILFNKQFDYYNSKFYNELMITIEYPIRTLDENSILKILKDFSFPVFFQLDSIFNLSLKLEREPNNKHEYFKINTEDKLHNLIFPKIKYNEIACELYFNAINSKESPSIQFLNFYQILEFYFSAFTSDSHINKMKNILKSATFDLRVDEKINELYDIIKSSVQNTNRDEKNSLKIVIENGLKYNYFREIIQNNEEIKKFFLKDKKLSKYNLDFHELKLNDNFISNLTNRIYDIRCQIVHKKVNPNENENEIFIYPNSEKEYLLKFDIFILKEITRNIIYNKGYGI